MRDFHLAGAFLVRINGTVASHIFLTQQGIRLLRQAETAYLNGESGLSHEDIAEITETAVPDWDTLLQNVLTVPTGRDHATAYHLAIEQLLTALFYPALDFMKHEYPVDQGRERIDITYTNIARSGFFDWVNRVVNAPAHEIYVECKNYTKDVGNPELDQLAGRLSVHRGRVGLMLYRSTSDKERVDASSRDH